MKRFIIALTLLSIPASGCAVAKNGAAQFVVASDAAADELAAGWEGYVDDEIARCSNLLGGTDKDTKDGRKECMGLAGEGEALEVGLEALIAAQLAVKIAVECDSNPLKVPAEFKEQCVDGAKTDWVALFNSLKSAWETLKPYYNAMKERK